MRPVSVFPDYLVKLVIPASRAITKPAVICLCVPLVFSINLRQKIVSGVAQRRVSAPLKHSQTANDQTSPLSCIIYNIPSAGLNSCLINMHIATLRSGNRDLTALDFLCQPPRPMQEEDAHYKGSQDVRLANRSLSAVPPFAMGNICLACACVQMSAAVVALFSHPFVRDYRMHTRTHAHTHTNLREINVCTDPHPPTPTHICERLPYAHTHTHTRTHSHTHTHTHTHTHLHTHLREMTICTHTHTHLREIVVCTHTHRNTHAHTCANRICV